MTAQQLPISKIIHYCWFGGKPLPKSARRCIESWRKYLPDYEIQEWNETNFHVNAVPYTAQAYKAKKYAFVSDYARFKILYEHGGLYFDTDVEVIRPLDDIVATGAFMGCENASSVNPGLGIGAPPGLDIYKEILDFYDTLRFENPDGSLNLTTVVDHTTGILRRHGLRDTDTLQQIAGCHIYPKEYFCPKDYYSGKCHITPHTRTIHHYAASWVAKKHIIYNRAERLLGKRFMSLIYHTWKRLHR